MRYWDTTIWATTVLLLWLVPCIASPLSKLSTWASNSRCQAGSQCHWPRSPFSGKNSWRHATFFWVEISPPPLKDRKHDDQHRSTIKFLGSDFWDVTVPLSWCVARSERSFCKLLTPWVWAFPQNALRVVNHPVTSTFHEDKGIVRYSTHNKTAMNGLILERLGWCFGDVLDGWPSGHTEVSINMSLRSHQVQPRFHLNHPPSAGFQ